MAVNVVIDTKFILYKLFYQRRPINEYLKYIVEEWEHINKNITPSKIYFVIDSATSIKQNKYPFYKNHRDEKKRKSMKPTDYKLLQEYLQDYRKIHNVLKYFGTVIELDGYEADDLAYLITKNETDDKYVLFTSDQDWLKLLKPEKVTMFHIDRRRNIPYSKVLEEYEYTVEDKKDMDIFIGSPKENVTGIYKLGVKTFLKLKQKATENGSSLISEIETALSNKVRGMRLPEDVGGLTELVERNTYLLNFLDFQTKSDETNFFKQLSTDKLTISHSDLEMLFIKLFSKMYFISEKEKSFYKIS